MHELFFFLLLIGLTLNQTQMSIFETTNMPGKIEGYSSSYNDTAFGYDTKNSLKREVDVDDFTNYENNADVSNYAHVFEPNPQGIIVQS